MQSSGKAEKLLKRISQKRVLPPALTKDVGVPDLIDQVFLSYNAGRLREACQTLVGKMLADNATVGLTVTGALTPAGLGSSCIVPLIEAGFVDWIVSTGANLYHDTHFALGMDLHQSRPFLDDNELREHTVVRIYDIVFDYENLLGTDRFYRKLCRSEPFQKAMGTAEFHYLAGKYVDEAEKKYGRAGRSFLAAAYRNAVPIFVPSPGDSSIGMNLAALELEGSALRLDPLKDVNQSAAIVYEAKKNGTSGVWMLGGGSPKNFILQTEPQIQEVLGLEESGHDYFLQMTDARPDTGGLRGTTPSEATTWGKVDPQQLPNTVTCYLDSTVALPLMTTYALAKRPPRKPRRLMDRLDALTKALETEYHARRNKSE